jgi:hypothetical protein
LPTDLIDRFESDLKKKIGSKSLPEWGEFLATKNNVAFPVKHTGTLFKLYALYAYLIFPYLQIIRGWRKGNPRYRKFLYLDIFAGDGLNEISTAGDKYYLCGSALLAMFASHLLSSKSESYFDQMIMVDNNPDSLNRLSERLNLIISELNLRSHFSISNTLQSHDKVMVLNGDATDCKFINSIKDYLQNLLAYSSINIMFFIDPPAPESLRASTLKKLLPFPGDVLMLLHTGIFAEIVNKKRYTQDKLIDMLDIGQGEIDRLYSRTHKPEDLYRYYVTRYEKIIGNIEILKIQSGSKVRDVIKTVEIKTKTGHYVLLYATRRTGGSDPEKWQDAFETFARRISKLSETGELALQILLGKQKRLSFV